MASYYNLTNSQKNLLRKIVEYSRQGELDNNFIVSSRPNPTRSNAWICSIYLNDGSLFEFSQVNSSDLEALCDTDPPLISSKMNKKGTNKLYSVRQAAFDAVDSNFSVSPSASSSAIFIEKVEHSQVQIQQGSSGATQTGKFVFEDTYGKDLTDFIQRLESQLSDLKLVMDDHENVKAQIATIQAQLTSKHANPVIIRESLTTLRSVLEGTIGSLIASGLLQQVNVLLAGLP